MSDEPKADEQKKSAIQVYWWSHKLSEGERKEIIGQEFERRLPTDAEKIKIKKEWMADGPWMSER